MSGLSGRLEVLERATREDLSTLRDDFDGLSKRMVDTASHALLSQALPPALAPIRAKMPCKFFQSGACRKGDQCQFSHVPVAWSESGAEEMAVSTPTSHVSQFETGASVSIAGLTSAAELNGQVAVVMSYVPASGRYRVHLRDGSFKALRPENIVFPAVCAACDSVVTSGWCLGCDPTLDKADAELIRHAMSFSGG